MDVNTLRIAVTLLGLGLFLGLLAWAYSSRRRAAFDEAAQLPFVDPAEAAQDSEQAAR
jgi:cytochrome c oxidase cbb3-type subunit IV